MALFDRVLARAKKFAVARLHVCTISKNWVYKASTRGKPLRREREGSERRKRGALSVPTPSL